MSYSWGESEPICREIVALFPPPLPGTDRAGARSLLARHAMPLSASAIFAYGRNTVHASAMQAVRLAGMFRPSYP